MSHSTRRQFLGFAASAAWASRLPAAEAATPARHWPAVVEPSNQATLPPAQRVPFGWQAVALGAAPVTLRWPATASEQPTALRLAVALDMREEQLIEVALAADGRVIGTFDVRHATVFQPFELPLNPGDASAVRQQGVTLRQTRGTRPLAIFSGGGGIDPVLTPHLLLPGDLLPAAEFLRRMASLAAVMPFGWMLGCVLDGLLDLGDQTGQSRYRATARALLDLYLPGGRLVYESPTSQPVADRFYGIEGTGPCAALARLQPDHPSLDVALAFWRSHTDGEGCIIDGQVTSSEGAYTVGYPLAVLARARGSEELADLALRQVALRHQRLRPDDDFFRTFDAASGRRGNRLWARGLAWQMLGAARVLAALDGRADTAPRQVELASLAGLAQRYQRPDGLWSVFLDQPELLPDTAGSAGIAAALAIGQRAGWLPPAAHRTARLALAGCLQQLTADGMLGGVSQSNKGGEGLQRGPYRAIYQMGMGLLAQLLAALGA